MKYVNVSKKLFFKSNNDFIQYFIKGKKIKLLDVGNLGEGPVNVNVRDMVESEGGEYFGLDINKNLAEKLGFKNQLVGDLHNLKDVTDKSFDCIVAGEIIEHTWRPAEMIKECHRVLRDDGFLILSTPNIFDLLNVLRFYLLKKDTLGFNIDNLAYQEAKDNFQNWREEKKEVLSQPQHKILYGPAMITQLLNMHGFRVDDFIFVHHPKNYVHALLLKIFPYAAHMGLVARKASLEEIFGIKD